MELSHYVRHVRILYNKTIQHNLYCRLKLSETYRKAQGVDTFLLNLYLHSHILRVVLFLSFQMARIPRH